MEETADSESFIKYWLVLGFGLALNAAAIYGACRLVFS